MLRTLVGPTAWHACLGAPPSALTFAHPEGALFVLPPASGHPPSLTLRFTSGCSASLHDAISLLPYFVTMHVYDAKIVYSLVSLGDDVRLDQPDKVVEYLRSAFDENPLTGGVLLRVPRSQESPLGRHLISLGTISSTLVAPREVFRAPSSAEPPP